MYMNDDIFWSLLDDVSSTSLDQTVNNLLVKRKEFDIHTDDEFTTYFHDKLELLATEKFIGALYKENIKDEIIINEYKTAAVLSGREVFYEVLECPQTLIDKFSEEIRRSKHYLQTCLGNNIDCFDFH